MHASGQGHDGPGSGPLGSLAMADLAHSPLHDRHVALGAKLADFGGWEMPIEYPGGGVVAEHTAVRERVGVFDVSHLGKATVSGPGAADFVNACFTNDLRRVGPGQAQYTLCCDATGGVVDDLIQYLRADDDVFLIPNAANTAAVVELLAAAAPEDRAPRCKGSMRDSIEGGEPGQFDDFRLENGRLYYGNMLVKS